MKDIKIPGVLWVVLISVAIVLIETYVAPGYQLYAEGAIVVLMGIAKAANLGTKDVEDLVTLLRTLQRQLPTHESAAAAQTEADTREPNKPVRWLLG